MVFLPYEPMIGFEPMTYSLPWSCSTAELHWHLKNQWAGRDSNPRRPKPADLQSAPFDRFGTYPILFRINYIINLANCQYLYRVSGAILRSSYGRLKAEHRARAIF